MKFIHKTITLFKKNLNLFFIIGIAGGASAINAPNATDAECEITYLLFYSLRT